MPKHSRAVRIPMDVGVRSLDHFVSPQQE